MLFTMLAKDNANFENISETIVSLTPLHSKTKSLHL